MTTEDYISYPIALALKKHGFDWECNHVYKNPNPTPTFFLCLKDAYDNWNEYKDNVVTSAPTLSQAQKWLREKKGIAINVIAHGCHEKYREGKYHWEEIHLPNSNEKGPQWVDWFIYGKHPLFDTYEEALSDGLSQMLELIEKEGE